MSTAPPTTAKIIERNKMLNDLPTALRKWRAGYTAKQAAAALGVNRQTYLNWEMGRPPGNALGALLIRAILTPIEEMIEVMPPEA